MTKRADVTLVSLLALCACFSAPAAYGQAASTGAIQGTIADPSGAAVPGVEVTATNVATGRSVKALTSDTGFYTIEALLAGVYDITAQLSGFKTSKTQGVRLDPGQRLGLNLALELGEVATEVTVAATAVKVQTESGEVSGVITGEHIENLLLNGRNFLGLALLIPGVNSSAITGRSVGGGSLNAGGLTGETPLSINGLGREFSLYTIDGAYNMNTGNNININITPPLDTISEFRVLKDNYSAKYGVAGSAQVMVESKSGTQKFHGAAYEFLRNDKLDASNFFAGIDPATGEKRRTPLKQNNFGFAFNGPFYIPGAYNVDKKKTFFFVNEEWRRIRSGLTLRGTLIPDPMRKGDFSQSPTLPTDGLKFDDVAIKFLSQRNPGVNCLPAPTQLNPACFDQNAVNLMNKFWPLPNDAAPGRFLNYVNPGTDKVNNRNDTYRVDHYLSEKLSLMGRFMYEVVTDEPPALTWGPNPATTTSQLIKTTGYNAVLRLTANISPTFINQLSMVGTHDKPRLRWKDAELPSDVKINLPFPGADPHKNIPTIGFAKGWSGLGVGSLPVNASDGEITLSDDFTLVRGSHVFQGGAMYIWGIKRQNLFSTAEGSYFFSGVHTGDPVADYLLGLNASFFQTSGERRGYFHYHQVEPYFQDDWKVNPRLTLNLGLRYVYFSPDTMESNAYTDFDPKRWDAKKAPVVLADGTLKTNGQGVPVTGGGQPADLLNGAVFAGKDGVPEGIYNAWKKGFAPRFGFALDLTGKGTTVLRGGYGIGYSRIPFGNYASLNNPPFITSVTLLNGTLTDPGAGVAGAKTPTGMNIIGPPNATFRPTMIQTWSLTLERQINPRSVASVGYVGSGARHVKASRDFNFPLAVSGPSVDDPKCLQAGQTIPSGGFNFDPCLNRNVVSSNFTRPFVGWGGFGSGHGAGTYFGTSNYHSLQIGFRYAAGRDLSSNTAYTWGKTLTDVANRGFDGRNTGSGAQDPRNFRAEYGRPGWDRTHIFTLGYIYEIPFLKNRTNFIGQALGHWTFSGIAVIQSGFAFAPGLATTTNGLASRPNVVGNVEGPKTLENWFNKGAFVAPPFGFFGNAGTGLIQGPGEQTWNMALFKTVPIREEFKFQFRVETFNIWNHANFDAVNTSLGSPNFGQVTRAMEPRILEFGLRLTF